MNLFLLLIGVVGLVVGFSTGVPVFTDRRMVKIQNFKRVQRSPNDHYEIHVDVPVEDEIVSLELKRNADINPNMKIEFENRELAKGHLKGVFPYQDINSGAAVMVSEKIIDGRVKRSIEGKFEHRGMEILISPTINNEDGEHFIDTPSPSERDASSQPISFKVEERIKDNMKRSVAKPHYHVEAVNIIDYTIWDFFLQITSGNDENEAVSKIRYQFFHIMNGVDLAYRRINDPRYMISVFVKKMMIIRQKENCPFTDGPSPLRVRSNSGREAIDARESLKRLTTWMRDPTNTGGEDWMDWDHTFLWTKKDLYSSSSYTTVGVSYVARVCTETGTSVNEYIGMSSWKIAAHELAHNLGSYHDGMETSAACSPNDKNIMSPSFGSLHVASIRNSFAFSQCSIDAIYESINGNDKDGFPRTCIMNKVCGNDAFNQDEITQDNQAPGAIYSLEEQCVLIFGNGAAPDDRCTNERDNVCQRLVCKVGMYCRAQDPGAEDGSPCGEDKVCIKGNCVHSSQLSFRRMKNHNSDCTSGVTLQRTVPPGCTNTALNIRTYIDRSYRLVTSCEEYVTHYPEECFSGVEDDCCKKCSEMGLTRANTQIANSNSACDPNPCKNSGVCRQYGSSAYVCECPAGSGGKDCDRGESEGGPPIVQTVPTPPCIDENIRVTVYGDNSNVVGCSDGASQYGANFCRQVGQYCCLSCKDV
ncbi:unnamed protein product [Dimorphilus gyrociliatus]|uniref:Uncharacterized protein n=1 Tax=Dimorphilus gyrociliatus TaxID=2664684 RepID=A0A7I8WBD7_9ANNE|nr:unnamed protein product [Dimorphilus gyrociliatus]